MLIRKAGEHALLLHVCFLIGIFFFVFFVFCSLAFLVLLYFPPPSLSSPPPLRPPVCHSWVLAPFGGLLRRLLRAFRTEAVVVGGEGMWLAVPVFSLFCLFFSGVVLHFDELIGY